MDWHTDPYANGDSDSRPVIPPTHADADRHAYGRGHGYSDRYSDRYSHGHAHRRPNKAANAVPKRCGDTH
jgi:hypothetical protein